MDLEFPPLSISLLGPKKLKHVEKWIMSYGLPPLPVPSKQTEATEPLHEQTHKVSIKVFIPLFNFF